MNHCMLGMITTRFVSSSPAKAPTSIACHRSSQKARPVTMTSTPYRPPSSRLAGCAGPAGAGLSSEDPNTRTGFVPSSHRARYERSIVSKFDTSSTEGYAITGSRSIRAW